MFAHAAVACASLENSPAARQLSMDRNVTVPCSDTFSNCLAVTGRARWREARTGECWCHVQSFSIRLAAAAAGRAAARRDSGAPAGRLRDFRDDRGDRQRPFPLPFGTERTAPLPLKAQVSRLSHRIERLFGRNPAPARKPARR
jgi:hypothetical protein